MFARKGLALIAACAALACAAMVRADDAIASDSLASATVIDQPSMLDDTPAPPVKPLTEGLDAIGVGKVLTDLGITVGGYVEGSWTYVGRSPNANNLIIGRSFDTESESILLDQLDLAVARTVDTTKNKFDIGFDVEQIYGADEAYIHSNGLTTYSPSKIGAARQPKNQYDLNQAYLSFALPIGKGVGLTIGKFDTLLGYEVIDGPNNPLFSHSFLFTQLPFTQTGALLSYNLTDTLTITAGVTRGWDQALKDVNGSLDATGQIKYTKDKITAYLNASTGDQTPTPPPGFPGSDGWRTVIDFIGTYAYSDNLSLTVNGDYGWQSGGAIGGGTSQWYGVALYGSYKISDLFTINLRGEWFDDQDGASPGTFDAGVPNTYYEATLGVKITPFPTNNILSNLSIRPEVRFDYADKPIWSDGTHHDQFTAAVEAYFTF